MSTSSHKSEEDASESDESQLKEDSKMLQRAILFVIENRNPTISNIQRHLKISYDEACELVETMEDYGLLSPQQDDGSRSVLVDTYADAMVCLVKHL